MAADKSDPAVDRALAVLRLEIDAIDNAMHDLLMSRAEIVDRVAAAKGRGGSRNGAPLFRAGREASILRRLIARNRGPLPVEALVGVWREIISSLTRLQGKFVITVFASDAISRYLDLARGHFGSRGPLQKAATIASALTALEKGRAQLAVLPVPGDEPDAQVGWWRGLGGGHGLRRPASGLHILARLPFLAGSRREVDAVVVGRQTFDPSADDRGYIAIETEKKISRSRMRAAMKAAGLSPLGFPTQAAEKPARGRVLQYQLVETSDWSAAGDPRLSRLSAVLDGAGVRSLGGYARPLSPASTKRK
ncbi:MAG: chorismate mutase [Alphaproteobacteria bacterium]|nr:chorismate mutase [Alphaproteobacteria bacterium]